jgi:hypothetical protein
VDFRVTARDEIFQVCAHFRLGRKRGQPREVGEGALVEAFKFARLVKWEPPPRIGGEAVEHRVEPLSFCPLRLDKPVEIHDHDATSDPVAAKKRGRKKHTEHKHKKREQRKCIPEGYQRLAGG